MKFVQRLTQKGQVSEIRQLDTGDTIQEISAADTSKLSATDIAGKILRVRADIDGILAPLHLPISPILDMLLDLFLSEENGRKVSVTDVTIAGHCSPSTGLRWVGVLKKAGLVQKTNDELDHRRIFVSLTDRGRTIVLQCIEAYTVN